jgi:hypothetical protein
MEQLDLITELIRQQLSHAVQQVASCLLIKNLITEVPSPIS